MKRLREINTQSADPAVAMSRVSRQARKVRRASKPPRRGGRLRMA